MNIEWLYKIFKKEKLEKLNCGSINTGTGEFKRGYRKENGEEYLNLC